MATHRNGRHPALEWLLSGPTLLWLALLFVLPTLFIFSVAFRPATLGGGIGEGWTLETLRSLGNPSYPEIIWRTVYISAAGTVLCIGISIPVAYWLARQPLRRRNWVLLLIILPFWTNFLIRIFAWRTLLHPEGWFKQTLVSLRLVAESTQLLYNSWAILLVLVYTYLPFAILPLYAAAEKFDFSLLDAARDLGASRWRAFREIFLPGIRLGILTAFLIVFIPALGSYAIPAVVGGPASEMVGNKIAQRVFTDRNLPHASALSAVLALAVFVPLLVGFILQRRAATRATQLP
jgi:ABC-type spermidine/putrescine transport system permease subunit I